MRQRSLAGPLILIGIGCLFLLNNIRPDFSVWDAISRWWPFLLIAFGVIRLAEVLFFYNRGQAASQRGISGGQVWLIALICVAAYAATNHRRVIRINNFQSGGVQIFGEQYDYPIAVHGDALGVTMLVLDNLRGNVTVSGSDEPGYSADGHKSVKAYNKAEADVNDSKTQVRFVREGNQLIVRTDERGSIDANRLSTDMEIRVPRGVSVEARGRSGDLSVNSIAGMVDIQSDRGDIRLSDIGGNARVAVAHSGLVKASGLKGNLDVEGRGSDVQLENVAGQVSITGSYSGTLEFKNLAKPMHFESDRTELRIAQIAGTFTMDLGDIRASHLLGPVKLRTRSRDVHIDDFTDSMDLEMERGDIELTPGKLPLARIDVRSHNGNVDVTLPDRADFNLSARTGQGEVHNEFGDAVRTEIEGRSASLRSANPRGAAITLSTDRGAITVKKS